MKQFLLVFIRWWNRKCTYVSYYSRNFNALFSTLLPRNFFVNIIGCLIIGFVLGSSLKGNYFPKTKPYYLTTGFCGGFTTFSAFALENHSLLQSGEILHFSFIPSASIAVGIIAVI